MSIRSIGCIVPTLPWIVLFSLFAFGCESAGASFVINMGSVNGRDIENQALQSTLRLTFTNGSSTIGSNIYQGVFLTINGLDSNDYKLNTVLFNVYQPAV